MKAIHRTVFLALLFTFGCGRNAVDDAIPSNSGAEFRLVATVPANYGGTPLSAELSGANEVPPADPDGSGTAKITLNQGQGEVCYELSVSDIAPATGAHIHAAPAGTNGGVVVPLDPPTDGSSDGCATGVDKDLIKDIRQNPENYYVNIHNADFPAGAIRGQLHKAEDDEDDQG